MNRVVIFIESVLLMLNTCFTQHKITKVWKQLRIIGILKQEKTLRFQRAIDQSHSYVMHINCTNDSF